MFERYLSTNNTWEKLPNMKIPRYAIGVAVVGTDLYAIGGCRNSSCKNAEEAYDVVER